MRQKYNAARRVVEEAIYEIRFRAEVDIAKIERAEADTSANVEADIK